MQWVPPSLLKPAPHSLLEVVVNATQWQVEILDQSISMFEPKTDSEEEDERYKSGYQNGNAYYVSLSVFLET